jgi:glyoxylase I family protein
MREQARANIIGAWKKSPESAGCSFARRPKALAAWDAQHLGVAGTPTSEGEEPWAQEAGPTVFAPFKQESDYFPKEKTWMINFRVANLHAMVAQLAVAGIEPTVAPDESYGRFARLYDPEGNAIELWQPL